jgi:hypothetical protein
MQLLLHALPLEKLNAHIQGDKIKIKMNPSKQKFLWEQSPGS